MMTETERALIEACVALGVIAETTNHYTEGLARRIDQTGKTVHELTVGELLKLDAQYNRDFNRIHG
jgi:hypothetical protein